ncbi:uncharacterized protein BXZ73DRAFT_26674, partial [Epithele typhae]|uniref:uncharacterized protein n=1 Tax=Epithele typhae TaxID=378194 RepID=UPI0020078652
AKGHPEEARSWINCGRHYIKPSKIVNIPLFVTALKQWWTRVRPDCRHQADWPLLRDVPLDTSWQCLELDDPNGIFMVIMCLSWW